MGFRAPSTNVSQQIWICIQIVMTQGRPQSPTKQTSGEDDYRWSVFVKINSFKIIREITLDLWKAHLAFLGFKSYNQFHIIRTFQSLCQLGGIIPTTDNYSRFTITKVMTQFIWCGHWIQSYAYGSNSHRRKIGYYKLWPIAHEGHDPISLLHSGFSQRIW